MLINLSNHPSSLWSEEQRAAGLTYGEIVDVPFPPIDPEATTEEVEQLAEGYLEKCKQLLPDRSGSALLVTGELTFCFSLVQMLLAEGYICLAPTSKRNVIEEGDTKIAQYTFKQFREYKLIN